LRTVQSQICYCVSFGKGLYEDGYFVSEHDDKVLDRLSQITKEDKQAGFIYILESLSQDDKIKTIKNLYKIGYSTTDVRERIKNAANEPTYLMDAGKNSTQFMKPII